MCVCVFACSYNIFLKKYNSFVGNFYKIYLLKYLNDVYVTYLKYKLFKFYFHEILWLFCVIFTFGFLLLNILINN